MDTDTDPYPRTLTDPYRPFQRASTALETLTARNFSQLTNLHIDRDIETQDILQLVLLL